MTEIELKAAIRKRDNNSCTLCGMNSAEHFARYGRDLEVHRLIPGSEYTFDGCVTVCRKCHGPLPRSPRGTFCLLFLLVPELLHRAIQLRKLKLPRGTTLSDVVNGVLEGTMPPLTRELGELRGFDHESSEQTQPKAKKKP